jgi:hypothetical protein
MRLEVCGKTKGKATWIPSMLSINLDDEDCTQINYDISGDLSFTPNAFDAYCKGDLLIEEDDDYVDMDDKQIKDLFKMLKNPKNEIIITVYPNEDDIECDDSEITDCVAHLELWDSKGKQHTINFKFIAEYVE